MGSINFSNTAKGSFVDSECDGVLVYGSYCVVIDCENIKVKADNCILVGIKNQTITKKTIKINNVFRLLFDFVLLNKLIKGIFHTRKYRRKYESVDQR